MDREDFKTFVIIILFIAALMTSIILLLQPIQKANCKARWEGTFNTKYTFISGCRIEVDNKWIPESAYREIPNEQH